MGDLHDWAEAYLRHRDIFERKIERLESQEHGFRIVEKDGTKRHCFVKEVLTDELLPLLEDHLVIVNRNRQENLEWVLRHWDALSKLPRLRIVFANVAKNEKWVLMPYSHDRVADPESLREGLESLFSSVPEE